VGLFGMMFSSLLINTTIPVLVRIIVARRKYGPQVIKNEQFQALILITVLGTKKKRNYEFGDLFPPKKEREKKKKKKKLVLLKLFCNLFFIK
jgi:hypothetical protein